MPGKRSAATRTRTFKAAKGHNLTLDEIGEFVAQARQDGIPGDSYPLAKIRISGKVHELTVQADAPTNEGDR